MNENLTSKLGNIKHILQNIEFLMFFGNELRRPNPVEMDKYSGQTHFIHTNENGPSRIRNCLLRDILQRYIRISFLPGGDEMHFRFHG